jgi:hypothetical protein
MTGNIRLIKSRLIRNFLTATSKFDCISGAQGRLRFQNFPDPLTHSRLRGSLYPHNPKMPPRSLNLVDLHRKFYKLPWLACGRYKPVRQSVEIT